MQGKVISNILIPIERCTPDRRNIFILFLLISVYFNTFPTISAYSQSDSLYNYLEIAAKKNPVIQQKFIEYQAALKKVPQVGSLSDPELSLGVFLSPMELVSGNQVADIRLMQMFPWFGVLRSAKDEMSLMANAKFELFRDTKLQVLFDVQRSWYDLYKVQKEISVSEKNIEILKTIERLALVKFQATPQGPSSSSNPGSGMTSASVSKSISGSSSMQGMSSGNANPGAALSTQPDAQMPTGSMGLSQGLSGLTDLYSIQMERGELENNIASLKSKFRTISAQFNGYLNRPPDSRVFIPGEIAADSLALTILSVSDSMLSNNPMLGMLDYEKKSIAAREKMVSRMSYPMLGLGLNYSLIRKNEMSLSSMNGKDMLMPMVTVTLPIYRKKYNAILAEAELLKTATGFSYQATANTLQTEYYQAVQSYEDAQRRVRLYDHQYTLSSKSFDLLLKSFSVSSAGLTEVLRMRQQSLEYELKQIEAVADFNIAIAWLRRLGNLESDSY